MQKCQDEKRWKGDIRNPDRSFMGRARQLYGQESSCQWPFIGPMLAAMVRFSTNVFWIALVLRKVFDLMEWIPWRISWAECFGTTLQECLEDSDTVHAQGSDRFLFDLLAHSCKTANSLDWEIEGHTICQNGRLSRTHRLEVSGVFRLGRDTSQSDLRPTHESGQMCNKVLRSKSVRCFGLL